MRKVQLLIAILLLAGSACLAQLTNSGEVGVAQGAGAAVTNSQPTELGLLFKRPAKEAQTNFDHLLDTGFYYYRKKNFKAAAKTLQDAVSLEPTNYDGNLWLGYAYCYLDEYDLATWAFRAAAQARPNSPEPYYWLGDTLYRAKRYDEAATALRRSLTLNTNQPQAWLPLGYSQYYLRRFQDAAESLRQAALAEPTNYEARIWRGHSLVRLGHFKEAATSFGEAVHLRPDDFDANFWEGISLLKLKKFPEATANLERARASKPGDRQVRWLLMASYLATGQVNKISQLHLGIVLPLSISLAVIYLPGLSVLLWKSLRLKAQAAPGFGLFFAWSGMMVLSETILAFVLVFLCSRPKPEALGLILILAALPFVIASHWGFARQPWGEPFSGPLRIPRLKMLLTVVPAVIGAFLVCFGYGHLVQYLTGKPLPPQRIWAWLSTGVQGSLWLVYIGIVLAGPAMEEILFRGLLFGALAKRLSPGWVVVTSAAIFSLAHLQLSYFVPLFAIGLALGWARHKSGGLGLSWVIHCLINLIALMILFHYLSNRP